MTVAHQCGNGPGDLALCGTAPFVWTAGVVTCELCLAILYPTAPKRPTDPRSVAFGALLDLPSDEQRLEVFARFCTGCGRVLDDERPPTGRASYIMTGVR